MNTPLVKPFEPMERLLVRLEDSPCGECYRVIIGLAIVPALSLFWGRDPSIWVLGTWLLVVLGLLRVIPVVARRLFPFSNTVRRIWARRRQIAKRCDSYQWQKLFWVGIGLALNMLVADHVSVGQLVLTSACLTSGAAGIIAWRCFNARRERARWLHGERTLA